MKKYTVPHLKLGGTSFLLHAGYVPAMRFAAERCEDVGLLLTETGEHGEYLPTPEEIREIGRIVDGEGTSLHVHLPTEADFGTPQGMRAMVHKVRCAVDRAAPLHPHSFVLHVDFPELHGVLLPPDAGRANPAQNKMPAPSGTDCRGLSDELRGRTAETLREIAACLSSPEQLAVENLESFPADFWDGWLNSTAYSRCLDIGHIWKDNGDPSPTLAAWLPRIRVIHLHGLEPRETGQQTVLADERAAESAPPARGRKPSEFPVADLRRRFGQRPRDHKSLRFMPPECLDAVMHPLWEAGFAGVLNLEVFSFDDFAVSHAALLQSWERRVRVMPAVTEPCPDMPPSVPRLYPAVVPTAREETRGDRGNMSRRGTI